MKQAAQLALGMLLATASISSYAAAAGDIYVTGSVGLTSASADGGYEGNATGFKLGGGYVFTPNIGIEGYWIDHGETDDSGVKVDTSAIVVSAVGMFPVNPQFDLFGKVGMAMWDGEAKAEGFGSTSNDGTDVTYGFGGAFHLNDQMDIRAEFEMVDMDDYEVTFISGGVNYKIK